MMRNAEALLPPGRNPFTGSWQERVPCVLEGSSQVWSLGVAELGGGEEGRFLLRYHKL